jgi:hypothetical protein
MHISMFVAVLELKSFVPSLSNCRKNLLLFFLKSGNKSHCCVRLEISQTDNLFTTCVLNRTGQGPSPWLKLDKSKAAVGTSAASENAVENLGPMMRTGYKGRVKVKAGIKKANSWGY